MNEGANIEPTKKIEEEVEKVAKELNIELPKTNLPWLVKVISILTLVGGLSVAGGAFADIFNPAEVSFIFYILRLLAGVAFIAVSYGLIKQKRWGIWIYGLAVILGIFINPTLAILPIIIVAYLYTQRNYFEPSVFDKVVGSLIKKTTRAVSPGKNKKSL